MSASSAHFKSFDVSMREWVCSPNTANVFGANAKTVLASLKSWWGDFQNCGTCKDAAVQLRETRQRHLPNEYRECHSCLLSGESPFGFQAFAVSQLPSMTLEKANTMLDQYRQVVDEVSKEHQMAYQQHHENNRRLKIGGVDPIPLNPSSDLASNATLLKERELFLQLTVVAFDWGRTRLIQIYRGVNRSFGKPDPIEDSEPENGRDKNGKDMIVADPPPLRVVDISIGEEGESLQQFLREVCNEQRRRCQQAGMPMIWCSQHRHLGDAYPLDGRLYYLADCYICEWKLLPSNQESVAEERKQHSDMEE